MMNFGSLNVGLKQVDGTWVPRVFEEKEMARLLAEKQHARVMRATQEMMKAPNPFAEFDEMHQRGNPFAGRVRKCETREPKSAQKPIVTVDTVPVAIYTDVIWPENGKVHALSRRRAPRKHARRSKILACDLLTQVLNISRRAGKSVEVIGKRRCCLKPRRRDGKSCFGVITKHHKGVLSSRDMVKDLFVDSIIEHIAYTGHTPLIDAADIKPGDSGLIYREKKDGYVTRVVRGRHDGDIIDARDYVRAGIHTIKHY
nr:P1 protein [Ryegrass mosaic virus]